MRGVVTALRDAADLMIGGLDFAIGRVGGRFGDRVLTACIDVNLSWCGAEYLWAFLDRTGAHRAGRSAATRVYQPTATASLAETAEFVAATVPAGEQARVIACVPGTWGMLAVTGPDPLAAGAHVTALTAALGTAGLATC
jgi:hypothetical protein